ncbi:epsin-1-like isoform X3 [Dreissena polymorpha]|uniref:epsin-1-like isoform X3 n=1 Tax=Dreissena polymorpha TaxID=45954 RepID=UPI0022644EF9|nr:epsin-1-like isoform X3 [Dreissena polymorpha]
MPMRRTLKNVVKNYTDAQVKVREATSNDPWGPSSTLMTEIADLTYNVVAFTEIMQMIWKRLNDHGKNWRHVYKSLVVLDYIIKTGSEKVAQQCRENIYAVQTLKDFQYMEDNKDQGMNVREKAKQLVSLLKDDERLRNERAKALKAKERFAQSSQGVGSQPSRSASAGSPTFQSSGSDSPVRRRRHSNELESVRPASIGEEELQLQLALAMSREEHEEQLRKQKSDDIKLQMALDESRKQQENEDRARGHQTLAGMAGQAAKSDPWGMPSSKAADPWGTPSSKASEPWGTAIPAPPGSHHRAPQSAVVSDPWSSPGNQASIQPPADPWSSPPAAASPQHIGASMSHDPWSSPAPSSWGGAGSAQPVTGSLFDSSFNTHSSNGTSHATGNNIDEAFDVLGTRMSPPKTSSGGGTAKIKVDPWDMSALESSMNEQPKRNKTPQEFLGANSGLVNLDELVRPDNKSKKANNPFASPQSTNPFEQVAPQRVPMSQLQANTYNTGFTQPSAAGLLPAPLVPLSMQQTSQPHGYNPFL